MQPNLISTQRSSDIGIGNSLEGFLTIFPKKDKQLYEYFIYDRNNREITETISFLSAKNELSYEDINKIISSVELRSVPLKSAEEFFQDGLSSMEKNQYEEAKFSLANALYQNWQNPKYNYYLGNVFLKTNKYLQAKYYLGRSQEYLDAKTLLEHIKKEDSRGSILNSP
ncbi:MAG: hypothetical protein NT066_00325 [Candidatus Omnitrophica bacterium]|nr:hypothetical protein [Candidatus Omnitrophota bacterium]